MAEKETNEGLDKQANQPAHVIVVGAGIAGLCAAFELERRGFRCTILEAEKERVGGRVFTYHFEDGQYGELGAMRIPAGHKKVLKYIKKFGLETRPFVNSNKAGFYYARGRKERMTGFETMAAQYQLRPWEQKLHPDEIWDAVVKPIAESLTKAERKDIRKSVSWKTRKIHDFDHMSLHRIFELAGVSAEAIEYFCVLGAYGETLLGSGFIEHLREQVESTWLDGFLEIKGGMDRLPNAFKTAIRGKVKMGCTVTHIIQDTNTNRVTATYVKNGREKSIAGDYMVCALPFSVMQDIEITPAMSGGKQRAIRQMYYEAASKVLINTKSRFWEHEDGIIGGASYTDMLCGPIFYPSDNAENTKDETANGPGVLIGSYNWGEAARRLGALPPKERERLIIGQVSKVHPQLKKTGVVKGSVSMAWGENRHSRGAFSFYAPGQFARLQNDVISVEGCVHFAGEHTSSSHTWIEGAIVSGRRVAKEIGKRHAQK